MQTSLPSRYALILDQDTIQTVLKRAAQWNLPRRECHPLDHYNGKRVSKDVARYDEEIDANLIEEDVEEASLHAAADYVTENAEADDDFEDREEDFN